MKISSLLESQTPSSSISNTTSSAPEFGRDEETLEETSAGATGSGSIASVASPIGKVQSRGSIFNGIKTSKKFPNSVSEETLPLTKARQQYIQAAKDVLKGADFDHIARVRNLDSETLRKFVAMAHEKLNSGEYKINRPNLEEQGVAEGSEGVQSNVDTSDPKFNHLLYMLRNDYPVTRGRLFNKVMMNGQWLDPDEIRELVKSNQLWKGLGYGQEGYNVRGTGPGEKVYEQGVAEGEVLPFKRPQQQAITWQQLPKDVLRLANDWYWAEQDDSGVDALMDPKGFGNGTANELRYIAAKLQQAGWSIDYNDEHDGPGEFNLKLTNRRGQTVLLPIEDAQDFTGWAKGTNSMTEQGVAEGSLEEYGDTPKGQKMLGKVHHRAADRVTSKKSDTDPAYARKAQQTQDRAWERLAVKEQGVDEGEVVQFKQKNPLTPNLIKQLKALSQQALELFWEGSYMPTAAQGQVAQLGKNEEQRMFKQNEAQFKALGYEYSINEESQDILYLHSIAREAWYDADKPANMYRGLPDLMYNAETNTLSYYDLIGDDGYEYNNNTQFEGVAEGIFGSKENSAVPLVNKIAQVARQLTPQNVNVGKQIIQSNADDILRMMSPQAKTGIEVIEQGVAEAKNPNPRVNEIRELAKDFFDDLPYSSGTIGGGKILRLSFFCNNELSRLYRYVPFSKIDPKDQQILRDLKANFEQFMASNGVGPNEVSMKFHVKAGVYASVRIAIPQQQGVAEANEGSLSDEFAKMAMKKFPKALVRQNGKTLQEPPKHEIPQVQQPPVDVAELERQYTELKKKYQQLGGDSWQYADRMMPRDREAQQVQKQMNIIAHQISNAKKNQIDEAEISEEMLAHELYKDLQIFKKAPNKDISGKAKNKDLSNKPKDKEIINKVTSMKDKK